MKKKFNFIIVLFLLKCTCLYSLPNGFNQPIDSSSNSSASSPSLSIDQNNQIYCSWEEFVDQKNWEVKLSVSNNGGLSFSSPIPVDDPNGAFRQDQSCVFADTNGIVHVVWRDYRNGVTQNHVRYCKSIDGGHSFSGSVEIVQSTSVESPVIVVTPSGVSVAAWRNDVQQLSGDHIQVSYSSNQGLSWAQPVTLDLGLSNETVDQLDMAIDVSGTIFLIWRSIVNGKGSFYVSSTVDGGVTWSSARVLSNLLAHVSHPNLYIDSKGVLHLAWVDYRNHLVGDIYYCSSSDQGLTWTKAVLVDDSESSVIWPNIVEDGDKVYVIWEDRRNGYIDLRYAGYSKLTDSFAASGIINDQLHQVSHNNHKSAFLPNLGLLSVWEDSRSGVVQLYYNLLNFELISSPIEVKAKVGEEETSVDLSWNVDSSEGIRGYRIYRRTSLDLNYGSTPINDGLVTELIYSDSSKDLDKTYYYVITSVNHLGKESSYSEEVSLKLEEDTSLPQAPTGLELNSTETAILLSWEKSVEKDFDKFEVYRSMVGSVDGNSVNENFKMIGESVVPNYQDSGLIADVFYTYAIKTRDKNGNVSNFSEQKSVVGLPGGGGQSRSGCIIWNVGKGTFLEKDIAQLSTYKNEVLIKHDFGRYLTSRYSQLSNLTIDWVSKNVVIKSVCKVLLISFWILYQYFYLFLIAVFIFLLKNKTFINRYVK